jgi:RNase P protein component
MSVKYVANKGFFAAAVVVPKRVAKGAVLRNSIRRAVYKALQSAPSPRGVHAVFMIDKLPPLPRTAVLGAELERLCGKIV